jgi:hypothetical protein
MTDDTVTAKIAEWAALEEGATKGPWEPTTSQPTMNNRSGYRFGDPRRPAAFLAHQMRVEDAEFIGAARTAMPALLGFVREVLEGHEPDDEGRYCGECSSNAHGNALVPWPCPTEQAARKWLGGDL